MAEGLPVERLRQYLRELKPEARAMLVSELERSLLRGEDTPGAQLVLAELRRDARDARRPSARIGNLARLFFQPLEPFLVDDVATHSHPGRIARVALDPVWNWVCRDLLPGEVKSVTDDVARAYTEQDTAKAEILAREFQDRVVVRMQEALQLAAVDEKSGRRLSVQISSPRALEDAHSVFGVLERRDVLSALADRLPRHISALQGAHLDDLKVFLDSILHEPHLFLYALILVMGRLAAPWQLVRLAVKAAGDNTADAIAKTPYQAAISIVMPELERMIGEMKAELHSGTAIAVGALLKAVHDAIRGLRSEIKFKPDSTEGQKLEALRNDVAHVLKGEIESMPGRARRLLRLRPAKDIVAGSMLSQSDIDEMAGLIAFVGMCRPYAEEFKLGDVAQRSYADLQHYLEANPPMLIDALRKATDVDRNFLQSQFGAAVCFTRELLGEQRAAQLKKSAETLPAGRKAAANG